MRIKHRRPALAVVVLMTPAVTGLLGVVGPGYATGGTNLLTNGGFEASGGSLTGWSAVGGKLSLASDGDGGGHAALASVNGNSRPAAFGLTTASGPVTGAPAGETFAANARIRSATPGRTACIVLRELSPGGGQVQTVQQCGTATATWASLPTTAVIVRSTGDSISLTVQQVGGARGDSFEADSLSLVNTDTSAPSVPTGVSATAPTSSEVDLSWNGSSDPDGAGVYGYVVSRNGAPIATLGASARSYRDTTVGASSTYSYTVAAFDYAGNRSAESGAATVTTPGPPADNPPSVPGGVTATAVSSAEVDVSWAASTDTDATGVAGYVVARNGTSVATVGAGTTSYADTTVVASTTYSYTVTAFDTAQNFSAPSSPATVTTPPGPSISGTDDLWHLDEVTGTTMVDSGQTPHPGLLHNIGLGVPGDPAFSGTSYGFNGTSSFVSIPNSADLNAGSKDVRIALSLNTTTVPAQPDYDLFRMGEYPGTEYKLELQPNGEFSCEFRTLQADGTTVKGYTIQPAVDLHDGKWHRLTCTKIGGTMTVTIDGTAYTKSITGSISNSYDMIIGAYSNKGGGDFYQGRLDEISFHIG
jgi:hypothetical protein